MQYRGHDTKLRHKMSGDKMQATPCTVRAKVIYEIQRCTHPLTQFA